MVLLFCGATYCFVDCGFIIQNIQVDLDSIIQGLEKGAEKVYSCVYQ